MSVEVAVHGGRKRGAPARARPAPRSDTERPLIRLVTFGALALYGLLRWATLESPAPSLRLAGLLALALLVAGAGPWLDRRNRLLTVAGVLVALLAMLAIAGIPVAWITHARVAVTARSIGDGLSQLPGILLPYLGIDRWAKLVIALGAGVLLLDAALMIAFAPRTLGDLRRAAAALPLIALAIVPSTLSAPRLAYVQGLILFVLVAAFMWGERLAPGRAGGAVLAAAAAGVAGALIAPVLNQHRAWIDYQRLTNQLAPSQLDAFNWTQSYGPFSWPRNARTVLNITAQRPDYWKAENLDLFNGLGWAQGAGQISASVPGPSEAELKRFTQTVGVTVRAMSTVDVIGAGSMLAPPANLDVIRGPSTGTWLAGTPLQNGDSYTVKTYSPSPAAAELAGDSGGYPTTALADELTVELPDQTGGTDAVRLPPFHSGAAPQTVTGPQAVSSAPLIPSSPYGRAYGAPTQEAAPSGISGNALIAGSPYVRAYALARRLAAGASSPYAFVTAVERYLSPANGFAYDENPPLSPYPLETFLFGSHRGYCQQFAGAMALLVRLGGLPARVATGFATGQYDAGLRQYVVSDVEAHAWVEVWFPRFGWVRFDPTPASAPARSGSSGAPIPFGAGLAGVNGGASASGGTRSHSLARPAGIDRHGSGGLPVVLLAIGLAAVLGLVALVGRLLFRGPKGARDLLSEFERALARCRRPAAGGTTLQELERSFGGMPLAQRYVRALRLARFAGASELPDARQRRALRSALGAEGGLGGRVRAWWALPPRVLH